VAVAEQSGGTFLIPGIEMFVAAELGYNANRTTWTPVEAATVMANAKEFYLAAMLLRNADPGRYGDLQLDTKNDFTRDSDTYPRERVRVFEILNRYESKKSRHFQGSDGISFNNVGENGISLNNAANITCHNCKVKGHYASNCPHPRATEGNADDSGTILPKAGLSRTSDALGRVPL
jgi:Zinc knuckle